MNKLNAVVAVLKFINGRNDSKEYLQGVCDYITDPAKTDNGNLVATQGCSKKHPLEDMLRNKLLHNKTHGKQGEHFVLALAPCGENKSPLEVLSVVKEIVATVYPENIAIIAGHTDSKYLHFHVALDAVNAVTGRKFSQSPADLNRVKQKANNILKKHGFEIITASANEFVDHTDYSKEVSYDFLELDESQFITKEELKEIGDYTKGVDLNSTYKPIYQLPSRHWYNTNNIGGNTMYTNNNYPAFPQQTQDYPTPTFEGGPTTTLMNNSVQDLPAPASAVEAMPVTVETAGNCYPTTSVVTGPTFRINGTTASNFAALGELVEQTSAFAQEHQHDAANLAIAMNQHAQQSGYPSNVAVYAGPIFDIDLTTPSREYDDYYEYPDGDYGAYK